MSKKATSHIFVRSFFILTIFDSCLTIMMRACKARALDEGGMMEKLSGQNLFNFHIFWKNYSLYIKIIHFLRFRSLEDSEPIWWHNLRMQSESSRRRRNDKKLSGQNLYKLDIFWKNYPLYIKSIHWLIFRSPRDSEPVRLNNSSMQSESSRRRRNHENMARP